MIDYPFKHDPVWLAIALAATLGIALPVALLAFNHFHVPIAAYLARYRETLTQQTIRSRITSDAGAFSRYFSRVVSALNRIMTPKRLLGGSIGVLALGLVADLLLLSLLIIMLLHALPLILEQIQGEIEKHRIALIEEALPDACGILSSALSAGTPLRNAAAVVAENTHGPMATEFLVITNSIGAGATMREALEAFVTRVPSKYTSLFAAAAMVNLESGGDLALVLQDMSASFTRIFLSEAEVRAKTAGARREGLLASFVPLLLLPVMFLMMPELAHILFGTPPGLLIVVVAAAIYVRNLREMLRVSNQEV